MDSTKPDKTSESLHNDFESSLKQELGNNVAWTRIFKSKVKLTSAVDLFKK